ncbi:DUF3040 domain-containing protein [Streptomyces sp. NPDC006739]|uniref:DUF3040 domain-containing protein n=1 Tax=Streptomyces sp. NPDC006739 TaxID=3364763 RepID=UPI0036AED6A2
MDDWDHLDDVRLSPLERLALLEIESRLSEDRRLVRVMRGPHGGVRLPSALPSAVALLAMASVFVVVMGIRTSDPLLPWCFAALWPLTLLQAIRLLRRLRRRPGGR